MEDQICEDEDRASAFVWFGLVCLFVCLVIWSFVCLVVRLLGCLILFVFPCFSLFALWARQPLIRFYRIL